VTGQGIGAWGAAETRFFYELTPDRILDAVEAAGLRPTGRCYALNSMENRVYDVEIEIDGAARTPSDRFRVIKFYRPGRWTNDQILAEHEFLEELDEHELPVVPPINMEVGSTLAAIEDTGLRYAIWPRIGGRIADELDDEKLRRLGRLMARVHNIGEVGVADERIRLDVDSYGRDNLAYLLDHDVLPADVRDAYRSLVEQLCDTVEPWFEGVACQRIHGDCHIGNVLWRDDDPYLVDFDDMVRGPCVQDLWLIVPGRDTVAVRDRETFLEAYEELRGFDRSTLRLVEPLRALRYIHFTAWIARRQDDPAFQRVFSDFGSERYWFEQISGLREQIGLIQDSAWR
jgi:Ser/Thr protein kinase RdoA (MazF antagonist)